MKIRYNFLIATVPTLWLFGVSSALAFDCPPMDPCQSCKTCAFSRHGGGTGYNGYWTNCTRVSGPGCYTSSPTPKPPPSSGGNCGTMPTCKVNCSCSKVAGVWKWTNCQQSTAAGCTTPAPPAIPTGLVAPKGSGKLVPISVSQQNIYYTSQTTDSRPILNADYESLPDCPGPMPLIDSSNTTNYSYNSAIMDTSPTVPDINNTLPKGTTDTPPPQCKVKSIVKCKQSDGTLGTCPTPPDLNQPIALAVGAVCPDGYAQVASFDMQPEVVYRASPDPAPYPIPDLTTYNNYVNWKYSCVPKQNINVGICIYSVGTDGYASATVLGTLNGNMHVIQPNELSSQWSDNIPTLTGGVGYFTRIYSDEVCREGRGCGGALGGCSLDHYKNDGAPNLYSGYQNNGVFYSQQFTATYVLMICTPPGGPYFTSNYAPRGFVCTRIKEKYDKLN